MPSILTPLATGEAAPWANFPPRMRVLFVTSAQRTGGWLAEAFAEECDAEVALEEAVGAAAGLSRLRDEVFDAVLVSHEPGGLDALALVHAVRAGGSEEPVILLGAQSEQELLGASFDAGADAYVCVNTSTSHTLSHLAARAIERHRLLRDNRRLAQAQQHRLDREREEARHLLQELHGIVADLKRLQTPPEENNTVSPSAEDSRSLPAELFAHYRELLRAYVIMGSGNLAEEVFALAELLASSGVSARQAMQLHLAVLEESVAGLGNRSGRHVMVRADLLVLELLLHLAEGYRGRYCERQTPARQMALPGFDPTASAATCHA